MINTIDEAINILNNWEPGIPFEAIEFLQNQATSDRIIDEIIFALKNAYADVYYDEKTDSWSYAPLWFAIVAEKHLSPKLIDPVISLFITTEDDWDFLTEQGAYLIGKLAEKYPDMVMEAVIKTIDEIIVKNKSELPYLYLFDIFYFVDVNKYKSWFLTTLKNRNLFWVDSFLSVLVSLKIKEAIPIVKELIKIEKDEYILEGLKDSLTQLEKGIIQYFNQPYCKTRGDWKEHYKIFEKFFLETEDEVDETIFQTESKKLFNPMIMEKHTYHLQKLMKEKGEHEVNKYLTEIRQLGDFPKFEPENAIEAAQEIIYDAWAKEDSSERIGLARKALEISPLCADAYVILAEESDNLEMAMEYYRKGVEAGELAL